MNRQAAGDIELREGGVSVIASLAPEWSQLLDRGPDGDPYSRPEWILAYLRAYSPQAKVFVLAVRVAGRLQGVLPLVPESAVLSANPGRRLRVPLPMPGGSTQMAVAPEADVGEAMRATWQSLKRLGAWDILEFPSVYDGGPIERLFELATADGYPVMRSGLQPVPYMVLNASPQELDKLPLSSGRRKHLRQAERKLNAMGQLRFRTISEAGDADLRRFYDLEASGWKGQEGSAIQSDPRHRQFFSEAAREAQRFGYFSLNVLELDGKWLAAHFGLARRTRYDAPKVAYDEAHAAFSPGHLIVREILRWCVDKGISEYSMGVSEEWKLAWTTTVRPRSFRSIYNRNMPGKALFMLRSRVVPAVKKLMRRTPQQATDPHKDAGQDGLPKQPGVGSERSL